MNANITLAKRTDKIPTLWIHFFLAHTATATVVIVFPLSAYIVYQNTQPKCSSNFLQDSQFVFCIVQSIVFVGGGGRGRPYSVTRTTNRFPSFFIRMRHFSALILFHSVGSAVFVTMTLCPLCIPTKRFFLLLLLVF